MYKDSYVYSKFVAPEAPETSVLATITSTPELLPKRTNWNCPNIEDYCVYYVQSKGLQVQGNAWDIRSNSDIPVLRGGVLLSGKIDHIGFIESIYKGNPGSILISESNILGCGIISQRIIYLNDPDIKGFIR